MVDILKNELKMQGEHYERTQKTQNEYYTQLAERSATNEQHIQELVTRLTSEKSQKYKWE